MQRSIKLSYIRAHILRNLCIYSIGIRYYLVALGELTHYWSEVFTKIWRIMCHWSAKVHKKRRICQSHFTSSLQGNTNVNSSHIREPNLDNIQRSTLLLITFMYFNVLFIQLHRCRYSHPAWVVVRRFNASLQYLVLCTYFNITEQVVFWTPPMLCLVDANMRLLNWILSLR